MSGKWVEISRALCKTVIKTSTLKMYLQMICIDPFPAMYLSDSSKLKTSWKENKNEDIFLTVKHGIKAKQFFITNFSFFSTQRFQILSVLRPPTWSEQDRINYINTCRRSIVKSYTLKPFLEKRKIKKPVKFNKHIFFIFYIILPTFVRLCIKCLIFINNDETSKYMLWKWNRFITFKQNIFKVLTIYD